MEDPSGLVELTGFEKLVRLRCVYLEEVERTGRLKVFLRLLLHIECYSKYVISGTTARRSASAPQSASPESNVNAFYTAEISHEHSSFGGEHNTYSDDQ